MQVDAGVLSGTVFEASGGSASVMGKETLDHSRALMGCVMGGPAGRPLGEAEPKGANKKAAMQKTSIGLKLSIAMALTCSSTLLGVGQEMVGGENSLKNEGGVGIYASTCFNILIR